jgi:hypothetical protein
VDRLRQRVGALDHLDVLAAGFAREVE